MIVRQHLKEGVDISQLRSCIEDFPQGRGDRGFDACMRGGPPEIDYSRHMTQRQKSINDCQSDARAACGGKKTCIVAYINDCITNK